MTKRGGHIDSQDNGKIANLNSTCKGRGGAPHTAEVLPHGLRAADQGDVRALQEVDADAGQQGPAPEGGVEA